VVRELFGESVIHCGYVYQSVPVHSDVHERAERGYVGDRPLQSHAGLQVGDLLDSLGEAGRGEFGARVTAGFFQFGEDVADRRDPDRVVDEVTGIESVQCGRVTEQAADVVTGGRDDTTCYRVGLGMHGRGVQWVVAAGHTQETGTLLERFRSEP